MTDAPSRRAASLSPQELEMLRLLAEGKPLPEEMEEMDKRLLENFNKDTVPNALRLIERSLSKRPRDRETDLLRRQVEQLRQQFFGESNSP
jgi:hypothetical protein